MKKIFIEKQKGNSFLLDACLSKLTLSNCLGPHKEKPGGLALFTAAVSALSDYHDLYGLSAVRWHTLHFGACRTDFTESAPPRK